MPVPSRTEVPLPQSRCLFALAWRDITAWLEEIDRVYRAYPHLHELDGTPYKS